MEIWILHTKKDISYDPFDKQLQDLIKQLEKECKEVKAKGKKGDERKITSERDNNDNNREYIGKSKTRKSRSIKQKVHVLEEIEIRNETEMPRNRTNSEVAENKAKASKAIEDLKRAEVDVYMLR